MAEQAKARPKHLAGDPAVEKVRALLKHFRSAMFTTQRGGELRTRPMGLMGKADEFDGTLWFFTDDRSHKLDELSGQVSLVCQSDADSAYLHLRGTAGVSRDRAVMTKRFDAESGEFWEAPGGLLQVIAAFTKSVVTGKPGTGGTAGDLEI